MFKSVNKTKSLDNKGNNCILRLHEGKSWCQTAHISDQYYRKSKINNIWNIYVTDIVVVILQTLRCAVGEPLWWGDCNSNEQSVNVSKLLCQVVLFNLYRKYVYEYSLWLAWRVLNNLRLFYSRQKLEAAY